MWHCERRLEMISIDRVGALWVGAVVACFLSTVAAFASGTSWMNIAESNDQCWCSGGGDKDPESPNYITLEMFIFSPSGAVLAHDAQATGYKDYLRTTLFVETP